QRLIKFHFKAADPPGDARSDAWFTYHLGKRLKQLYAGSKEARDQGFLNMTWDYEPEPEEVAPWRIKDEPSAQKIIREIAGFAALKADGSTTCASWIYSGVFPKPGIENLRAASRNPTPKTATLNGKTLSGAELSWGFAW